MDTKLKYGKNMSKVLSHRYILALSIIATLVILSQMIIQFTIANEKDNSRVINIAGRQRMLSQKLTKLSLFIYITNDRNERAQYCKELEIARNLWHESHLGLKYGNKDLALPGNNSKTVNTLFDDIEDYHQNILSATSQIIALSKENNYKPSDIESLIKTIRKNEVEFLNIMDKVVFQYDEEAKNQVYFIKNMEIFILCITLTTLIMEALFIFKPAEKEIDKAFQEIQDSHNNVIKIFETAPTSMFLIDEENFNFLLINKLAEDILGVKLEKGSPINFTSFINNKETKNILLLETIKNNDRVMNEELVITTPNNESFTALFSSTKICIDNKMSILIGLSDITKLKNTETILNKYATIDEMTGLLNKRSGFLALDSILKEGCENNFPVSIVFIDIDGLKTVNDTYGHSEGDWYIRAISKAIQENLGEEHLAFRYGGDEIVIGIKNYDCKNSEENLLKRIDKKIFEIGVKAKKSYTLSISYGVVDNITYPNIDIEELLKIADAKMYQVKKNKKE